MNEALLVKQSRPSFACDRWTRDKGLLLNELVSEETPSGICLGTMTVSHPSLLQH